MEATADDYNLDGRSEVRLAGDRLLVFIDELLEMSRADGRAALAPQHAAPGTPGWIDTGSPGLDGHRHTVLYIEDNETNVEIMRAMLDRRTT